VFAAKYDRQLRGSSAIRERENPAPTPATPWHSSSCSRHMGCSQRNNRFLAGKRNLLGVSVISRYARFHAAIGAPASPPAMVASGRGWQCRIFQ
jgi:hypothetical protein